MPVVRIESSSGGEMPALLNAMSSAAVRLDCGRVHRRHVVLDVTSARTKMPSDLVRGRLAGRVVDVDAHDLRALAGEAAGRRETDAAARTGDDGDLVVQTICHVDSFVEMNTFLTIGEGVEGVGAEFAAEA